MDRTFRDIKKIVWTTDGSKVSEEALSFALFLARRFGSQILGLHVIPEPEKLLFKSEFRDWSTKVEENINSRLRSFKETIESQGINFNGTVVRGVPSSEIVEYARREGADLIALGKSGLGLIDRLLIGSTALGVLRESEIPVLTVKKAESEGSVKLQNILVPVDISENVDTALNFAINLTESLDSKITVLYVFRLDVYTYEVPASTLILDDLTKYSYKELEKRIDKIKEVYRSSGKFVKDLDIKAEVIQSVNVPVAITDYASNNDIDLIVINTHGRKGIRRFILGSVTEKVLQESSCAVLSMKP